MFASLRGRISSLTLCKGFLFGMAEMALAGEEGAVTDEIFPK